VGGFENEIAAALKKAGEIKELLSQGSPPEISIKDAQLVTTTGDDYKANISVKLTEQGGGGGKVIFRVNGIVTKEENIVLLKESKHYKILTTSISLDPGENDVEVTTYNHFTKIESKPYKMKIEAPEKKFKKGNLYILGIGINEYKNPELNLSYAVNDCLALIKAMREIAHDQYYLNVKDIKLLNKNATKNQINQTLQNLNEKLSQNDLFLLYVASHGYTIEGRFYIMPWEVDDTSNDIALQSAGINTDELQSLLVNLPVRKSIIILDTCYSGGFTKDTYKFYSQQAALGRLVKNTGRAIICASSEEQASIEGYKGYGLFTYVFIDGLNGNADENGDNDNVVTVKEAAEYTVENVQRLSKKIWNHKQTPMYSYHGNNFPLGSISQ